MPILESAPIPLSAIRFQKFLMSYKILLYYHYTPIENPQAFMQEHRVLCNRLNLRGRILINHEGINGTVSGTEENTDEYMAAVRKVSGFENIDFKVADHEGHAFPKMKIKVRDEIITLKAPIDMSKRAPYIEADEMYDLLQKTPEDKVIVDARNEYEFRIGKFKNALTFDIDNFRDIPEKALNELEKYRDKEIITYCTGGVRCEPFSAFLQQNGFKVRQLHGGIIRYAEKHPEFGFDGHCYVFDNRISIKVNDNLISTCIYCNQTTARYINCKNDFCHKPIVCCEQCELEHNGYCPVEKMKETTA